MEIQLNCSDKLKTKIESMLSGTDITISDKAKLALVEKGYRQPEECICLVFDILDFAEVLEMLLKFGSKDLFLTNKVSGFANNRYSLLSPESINYFEARGARVSCFTSDSEYNVKGTLMHYEKALKSSAFIRINKSQLVNILNVKEIIPWFNSRLVVSLTNKKELEVSRFYSKSLRTLLDL